MCWYRVYVTVLEKEGILYTLKQRDKNKKLRQWESKSSFANKSQTIASKMQITSSQSPQCGPSLQQQAPRFEKQHPPVSEKQQPPRSEKQQPSRSEKQHASRSEKQHAPRVEKQQPPLDEAQHPASPACFSQSPARSFSAHAIGSVLT